MSRRPKRSTVRATASSTWPRLRTSQVSPSAFGSPRSSPLREASPTATPWFASARPIAAPIPRLAPVTNATLSSSPMLFLHSSDRRIQRAIASVTVLVARRPGSVRLDGLAHANARCDCLVRTCERAAGDAREERRPVRRALVDDAPLERQAERGRDDLEPEPTVRAAAGRAARRRLDAEPAQKLERVAQSVRHALEHGAYESAAVMVERDARERSPGVRIGMRRALALEVGEKGRSAGSGVAGCGLPGELVERPLGGEGVAEPAQRTRGVEHHAHCLPRAGKRMAEGMHASVRIVCVLRQ